MTNKTTIVGTLDDLSHHNVPWIRCWVYCVIPQGQHAIHILLIRLNHSRNKIVSTNLIWNRDAINGPLAAKTMQLRLARSLMLKRASSSTKGRWPGPKSKNDASFTSREQAGAMAIASTRNHLEMSDRSLLDGVSARARSAVVILLAIAIKYLSQQSCLCSHRHFGPMK
jgi:hypothetical protein